MKTREEMKQYLLENLDRIKNKTGETYDEILCGFPLEEVVDTMFLGNQLTFDEMMETIEDWCNGDY